MVLQRVVSWCFVLSCCDRTCEPYDGSPGSPSSFRLPLSPGSAIGGGCMPSGSPSGTTLPMVLNATLMAVLAFGLCAQALKVKPWQADAFAQRAFAAGLRISLCHHNTEEKGPHELSRVKKRNRSIRQAKTDDARGNLGVQICQCAYRVVCRCGIQSCPDGR
jgi:hypothetical protein